MYKMHIKVQNFTKEKKDPRNLDQTCNKTYYEEVSYFAMKATVKESKPLQYAQCLMPSPI